MAARVARKPTSTWHRFIADRSVSFVQNPVVRRSDHFFLMGSCFAEEIRIVLNRVLGAAQVGPDMASVIFDPAVSSIDELPERNHMNTYNAYSVLQEIERILGLWTPAPDDYWHVDGKLQCPYRRLVFADTPEIFADITAKLDTAFRAGFAAADHFVFTFGMTEVFVNRASGRAANQKPGYFKAGGAEETTYRSTTFADNHSTITRIVDLITAQKPEAKIFVTVSPVPLARTFSGDDIVVANTRSKATLRAVLAEVAETRPNVIYFPSYEAVLASGDGAWMPDGRHIRRAVVENITRAFVASAFYPDESAEAVPAEGTREGLA